MLTLAYNEGGALGTDLGSSSYYLGVTLILLPFIGYFIIHYRRQAVVSCSLAAVGAGAIGNVIDRLRLGKVIDFIDADFFDVKFLGITRWWTFNVADAAITCAIILLLLTTLFQRRVDPSEAGSHIR